MVVEKVLADGPVGSDSSFSQVLVWNFGRWAIPWQVAFGVNALRYEHFGFIQWISDS